MAAKPLPEPEPLIELTTLEVVGEADVARLDDLIEEVAASPADLASGEIDIMLEPAFASADADLVAEAGPLEGLEVMTTPDEIDALDGFQAEEPLPIAELLGADDAVADPRLAEPPVEEDFEPLAELESLEEFAVTEEPAASDAEDADDEFFVADADTEEPGAEFLPAGMAADEALVPELTDEFAAAPADLAMATVDELEGLVLEDPENPDGHRRLGEALLMQGETARASDEFELALSGYELREQREGAEALVDLLITLHPDSVRYYQKRVEYAYRTGDRHRLLEAYLDLGDALLRMQADDKAAAVYGRVLEHDPESPRARYGMQQLGIVVEPEESAVEEVPEEVPEATQAEGATPAPVDDEEMQVAITEDVIAAETLAEDLATGATSAHEAAEFAIDQALAETLEAERAAPAAAPVPPAPVPPPPRPVPAGDPLGFVDLGSLIIDDEGPRDTRMKGEQLETTGDEQRDFEDMLAQFKKGIDENVGHDDYEAHYDLGIAFKEMGLLDEAIAEFQKALRDPGGRLRTSEALGVAFFEKGQMAVAEAVLRRAVDTLEGGDDQKIGLVYWLGRACEAQGRLPEARQSYDRAMAVDIQFMDLRERVSRISVAQPQ
jgi:tetratricopeptide (TPR) repeat protein